MKQALKVVSIALNEVGYRENQCKGSMNIQKYSEEVPGLGWSQGQPWCQTFQSWIFHKADVPDVAPRTASCREAVDWFKRKCRFAAHPGVGTQVFYHTEEGMHVGIVTRYSASYIETVEGNTNNNGSRDGDGVYWKRRPRNASIILGYGYPEFSDGGASADPNAILFGYRAMAASRTDWSG